MSEYREPGSRPWFADVGHVTVTGKCPACKGTKVLLRTNGDRIECPHCGGEPWRGLKYVGKARQAFIKVTNLLPGGGIRYDVVTGKGTYIQDVTGDDLFDTRDEAQAKATAGAAKRNKLADAEEAFPVLEGGGRERKRGM